MLSVVYVEDDPSQRMLGEYVLEDLAAKHGIHTVIVESVAQARVALEEAQDPLLLITDGHLGDGNGVEIVAEAKKIHPESHCVIMSGTGAPGTGADAWLEKPLTMEALEELMGRLVGDWVAQHS